MKGRISIDSKRVIEIAGMVALNTENSGDEVRKVREGRVLDVERVCHGAAASPGHAILKLMSGMTAPWQIFMVEIAEVMKL